MSFSDEVIEADRSACARCESPTISTRLENVAFAVSVLRGKLDKACLDRSNPQSVRDVFQQSRVLDQELMAWRLSVPQEWEIFSVISPDERRQPLDDAGSVLAPTWLGYTASYPDPLIAKLMNLFRMHSIAIQSIGIRCADWIAQCRSTECPAPGLQTPKDVATDHDSSTHLKARKTIRTLVDGICASVPFHLDELALKGQNEHVGRDKSHKPLTQNPLGEIAPAASSGTPSAMRGPRRSAGGFMLLQPLVVAYSAPGVPADQRSWIMGKTLQIAKHIGMDEEMVEKVLNKLASD